MGSNIGAIIREARLAAGLTQEELGFRLNTVQQRIGYLERRDSNPRLSTLEAIANALGMRLVVELVPAKNITPNPGESSGP